MKEFVCLACFPTAHQIVMMGDSICLFENEGRFGLMAPQGHKRHELLYFPQKPIPDPDPESDNDDMAWVEACDELGKLLVMDAQDGFLLIQAAHKVGWRQKNQGDCGYDGCRFDCWLMQYCGKFVQAWEAGEIGVRMPDLNDPALLRASASPATP